MEKEELLNIDFTIEPLEVEYYQCTFKGCNFSGMRIDKIIFEACSFECCNLSLVTMNLTAWQEVRFVGCKMTGANFMDCNKFSLSVSFEQSIMHYAVFSGLNLQDTQFVKCELCEADFSGTNLTRASFTECDLLRTIFHHTNLEKADFFTAWNYNINPTTNKLRKARFAGGRLEGLLYNFGIEVVG